MKTINELLGYEKFWILSGRTRTIKNLELLKKLAYFDDEKKHWYINTSKKAISYKKLKEAGLKLLIAEKK